MPSWTARVLLKSAGSPAGLFRDEVLILRRPATGSALSDPPLRSRRARIVGALAACVLRIRHATWRKDYFDISDISVGHFGDISVTVHFIASFDLLRASYEECADF
jgi:hypothetical protein